MMWSQTAQSDESIVFVWKYPKKLHRYMRTVNDTITSNNIWLKFDEAFSILPFSMVRRYTVSHVLTHISIHFKLQLKLCCANGNENTMNQTENHYHSILFSEFAHSSTFFVMKTFQHCFPHICNSIFFIIRSVHRFFFVSLKWKCCTWPHSQNIQIEANESMWF